MAVVACDQWDSSSQSVSSNVNEDVVIIGAGLAGLACARTLTAAGIGVQLLEASDEVGGRVRSDHVDGFILDRGFQILLTAYPELYRWFNLDQFNLRRFKPGATIWTGRNFCTVGDPLRSPRDLPSTVFAPIGSIPDKLRLLKLIASVRRGSVPDLLRRQDSSTRAKLQSLGFSTRIIERFFQPLFAGIQLDPDLEVSSRRFEVILRMLAVGKSAVPADGMGALSKEMLSGLDSDSVRCNAVVRKITDRSVILESGEELTAKAVVVATQGPTASKLLGLPDPGSRPVAAIWFDSTASPIHNLHILLDGAQSGPMKNLAVLSDVAPSYAPPGKNSLCRRYSRSPCTWSTTRGRGSQATRCMASRLALMGNHPRRRHPPWATTATPSARPPPFRALRSRTIRLR